MRPPFSTWCLGAGAVILYLLAAPVRAIVNIEDLRVDEPRVGFSGQLTLTAAGETGNTDKSSVSLGTRLSWYRPGVIDFLVFNREMAKTDGVRDTDRTFLHGRHIADINERLAWEAFAQAEQNEFRRLRYRGLLGGGVRWTLFRDVPRTALYLGLGAFVEREELEPEPGATDPQTDSLTRANFYIVYKHRFNENVHFASTTFYQPSTSNSDDYRALEEAALVVKLTQSLDLKISIEVIHDNDPPQLVEKTDVIHRAGVEYRF